MKSKEIFLSFDVETDGPVPGIHSMLSMGFVALTIDKEVLGTYSANLLPLSNAVENPETMKWWRLKENEEAWLAVQTNRLKPERAIEEFLTWLGDLNTLGQVLPMAAPSIFDTPWISYYGWRFGGCLPFGHLNCLDARSFAAGARGGSWAAAAKSQMPAQWFENNPPHTHQALDDAWEQADWMVNMIRDVRGLSVCSLKRNYSTTP